MKAKPAWFYDEVKSAGVDYSNPAQVAIYDSQHQKFRDYRRHAEGIIEAIHITPELTVLDMGAGTGAFSLYAAPHCKTMCAADVSPAMLDYTRQKAAQMGLPNIVFCQGGFLTYEHQTPPVDVIVSVAVLHHLPDFWKLIGLRRIAQMLKPGGRFYLFDVVFPIAMADYETRIGEWVTGMAAQVGPAMGAEVESHIRDEYSTYDCVIEAYLAGAGFRIDHARYGEGFTATYLCTRL